MELTEEQIREIRILDLEKAFTVITEANLFSKELIAIKNAINFLREKK